MKAKSLIRYQIGYDPDKKQKSKSVEVEEHGAKLIYVIPIVSREKDIEFMLNEQIPPYKELAVARAYTGPEKFHFFGQYCSGPFKAAWENELAQNFRTNAVLSVWGQLIIFFPFSFFMPDLACHQKVWVRALYCPKMSL